MNLLQWFRIILWLITLHSLCIGWALILLPADFIEWFGLSVDAGRFFSAQGGVFHIAMSVAYGSAALSPFKQRSMLGFIISVKAIAFIFLAIYYLLAQPILVVLLSGFTDGFIALVVFWFYHQLFHRDEKQVSRNENTNDS